MYLRLTLFWVCLWAYFVHFGRSKAAVKLGTASMDHFQKCWHQAYNTILGYFMLGEWLWGMKDLQACILGTIFNFAYFMLLKCGQTSQYDCEVTNSWRKNTTVCPPCKHMMTLKSHVLVTDKDHGLAGFHQQVCYTGSVWALGFWIWYTSFLHPCYATDQSIVILFCIVV